MACVDPLWVSSLRVLKHIPIAGEVRQSGCCAEKFRGVQGFGGTREATQHCVCVKAGRRLPSSLCEFYAVSISFGLFNSDRFLQAMLRINSQKLHTHLSQLMSHAFKLILFQYLHHSRIRFSSFTPYKLSDFCWILLLGCTGSSMTGDDGLLPQPSQAINGRGAGRHTLIAQQPGGRSRSGWDHEVPVAQSECVCVYIYFPTCQVRVVRFYHSCSSSSSFLPPSSLLPSSPIFIASPICIANLHRQSASPICFADFVWPAPDRSVHPWTSTARIPSQCAPLDLNRKDPSAVCTPGPQPQGSPRSVHTWTSTARIRSQCASLDLNRKGPIAVCTPGPQLQGSDRSVHRWTSTR